MESTGKYWIPVFNLLEDEINVTIANPKWVKAVKGNKDDTKDSKWMWMTSQKHRKQQNLTRHYKQ